MKNNIERKESLNDLIEQIDELLESSEFSENSLGEKHALIKNLVSKKNISSLEIYWMIFIQPILQIFLSHCQSKNV